MTTLTAEDVEQPIAQAVQGALAVAHPTRQHRWNSLDEGTLKEWSLQALTQVGAANKSGKDKMQMIHMVTDPDHNEMFGYDTEEADTADRVVAKMYSQLMSLLPGVTTHSHQREHRWR